MTTSHFRVWAENAAVHPAHSHPDEYTVVDTHNGRASADVHLRRGCETVVRRYDEFAAVTTDNVTTYVEPKNLDEIVALRDALTAAIRHARKIAKENS